MKENSETCHKALMDYQVKYGDEALTDNESQFLYGVINYEEFKRRVSSPQDEPFKTLGIDKQDFVQEFKRRSYCTQNSGNCSDCSLVNYGKDCVNNPV